MNPEKHKRTNAWSTGAPFCPPPPELAPTSTVADRLRYYHEHFGVTPRNKKSPPPANSVSHVSSKSKGSSNTLRAELEEIKKSGELCYCGPVGGQVVTDKKDQIGGRKTGQNIPSSIGHSPTKDNFQPTSPLHAVESSSSAEPSTSFDSSNLFPAEPSIHSGQSLDLHKTNPFAVLSNKPTSSVGKKVLSGTSPPTLLVKKGGIEDDEKINGENECSHDTTGATSTDGISSLTNLTSKKFDFILCLDFEATCESNVFQFPHEIIEFPVVAIDVRRQRVFSEFHTFVCPVENPKLTSFCTQLTGITQNQVDCAPKIQQAVALFEQWFATTFPTNSRVIFATDGPWDLRDFMYKHTVCRQGIQISSLFFQYLNIRKAFADFLHVRPRGIKAMLVKLGYNFVGQEHSGLDDTRNLCSIVLHLMKRGCALTHVSRVIEKRNDFNPMKEYFPDDDDGNEKDLGGKKDRRHQNFSAVQRGGKRK